MDYPRAVARSDPEGIHVTWTVDSANPVTSLTVDLREDGLPGWVLVFPDDGRLIRGMNVRPLRNGVFTLDVFALDNLGRCYKGQAAGLVTVVS